MTNEQAIAKIQNMPADQKLTVIKSNLSNSIEELNKQFNILETDTRRQIRSKIKSEALCYVYIDLVYTVNVLLGNV